MRRSRFEALLRESSSDWLTVGEIARRLNTRESHIRALVAQDRIPFSKLGRYIRFHAPTIDRWLLDGGAEAPDPTDADVAPGNEGPWA